MGVMTWAPHPKSLPQAVPNSFAEWMNATDYEFVITHPEGYELDPKFVAGARVEYDQKKAFEGADFIYEMCIRDSSMTEARSTQGSSDHSLCAFMAASIAICTSFSPAL